MQTLFRISFEFSIPDSFMEQNALVGKIKPHFDALRAALGKAGLDYEIEEKVTRPRPRKAKAAAAPVVEDEVVEDDEEELAAE